MQRIFHQRGIPYGDIDISKLLITEVLVDENDVPVVAVFAKPTVEMFVLVDNSWRTPGWRWEALKRLHEVVRRKLADIGIEEAHSWIAVKSFRKRMESLGWEVAKCVSYVRRTRIPELDE